MWQKYLKIFQNGEIRLLSTFNWFTKSCRMAVKTPYCSLLRVSPLRCTTLNSFFKKRAAAGLTESIQHSLLDNSLLLFQEVSFFKYKWFLHSTEVPFGFFASWSKTWYEYHWSARIKVLGLCAEVNKDAFSMNLQLGRERWAEQTIPDCLILANRDKWPSG